MNSTPQRRRGRGALIVLALAATVLTVSAAPALAVENPNDASCFGHLQRGFKEPFDQPGDTEVRYAFSCTTPITGYQIETQDPITGFDTATVAYDGARRPVPSDAFSCNGDFPGFSVNCIGTYGASLVNGNLERVVGQFTIGTKLCAEPRVDALLSIAYATASSTGAVTQYLAGPFDLGRPYGCAKDAETGKLRAPTDVTLGSDTSGTGSATSSTAKKHRTKPKPKKTKRHVSHARRAGRR